MEKIEKNSKYSLTIPFIKELATYFMDFLETDFHKRRIPKRKIVLRTNDNLLSGISIKKFPSFYSKILTSISRESLDTEKISMINKGVYKCDVPKNLTDVVQLQLNRFAKKSFDEFNEKAKLNAEEMSILHKENINSAISKHTEFCLNLAKDNFVSVFVNTAREPLLDSGAVDENDIYRQKVLEGYGYRFLRINRFNLTEDPVPTLNSRILELVNGNCTRPALLENISNTIYSLQNGDMIECPKCNEIKPISEFKDSSLISGMGRYCRKCKGRGESRDMEVDENVLCPICNSRMVLRSGRYGRFYGCSRFPYCRGTRRI